jgi:hypothetical protein
MNSNNHKPGRWLCANGPGLNLILLFAGFFTISFARQSFLGAAFFAGLQIEGMPLHFFNNVLLLDFTFEPTQGIFKRLTLLQSNLCQ